MLKMPTNWGQRQNQFHRETVTANSGAATFLEPTDPRETRLLHFSAATNIPTYFCLYYAVAQPPRTTRYIFLKETVGRGISWEGDLAIPNLVNLYVYWEASVIDKTSATIDYNVIYQVPK